ncbi:UPF0175 family protein [Thiohalocapsa sp. ML1]|uniref:UPF0175 family protein n=1 Tax=Thiohalocapsa sp. ML1 TaxID=1431688 RepID=UPI0035278104
MRRAPASRRRTRPGTEGGPAPRAPGLPGCRHLGRRSWRAPALAAALFKDGVLSLGAAARVSDLALQDFLAYLTDLGIDVVQADETTD